MQLPDFLIIGAMKAGTTTLFNQLCAHPLAIPPMPDPLQVFYKGQIGSRLSGRPRLSYQTLLNYMIQ